MYGQNQHPLDAETSESLLAGLDGQGDEQVIPINRRKGKSPKPVEQPPPEQPPIYEVPTEYYSEQQLTDQQYPTTYDQPKEQWQEPHPRGRVTISRWRLRLLEVIATVSGSTLIFSVISLSPLGSIFLALSPQIVLGVMGTAILGVGFLGEIPLSANLVRTARKSTTVMLGVVLGYVFWWAIVSRTPTAAPTPNTPFITQPAPRL